ncbi:MAG: hypothetical protein UH734_08990 [Ruminococcus sp.]|nr:hypothetical protein [Ruminococcus sp.]
MADMQEQISQILNDPEAMRQVQSLGQRLGLNVTPPAQSSPPPVQESGGDVSRMLTSLAPMLSRSAANDETAALLNALRPFLSEEKCKRLDQAQRMMKLIKLIPLIKDSGIFL